MKYAKGWYIPDEAMEALEWALRHNAERLSRTDFLHAAAVVQGYRRLITLTSRERNKVIMQIRSEMLHDKVAAFTAETPPGESKP